MRTAIQRWCICTALILACVIGGSQTLGKAAPSGSTEKPHSYVPSAGFVPDKPTAIRIAVAVWIPIYGAKHIQGETPYHATLKNGVWTVEGSLPKPPKGYIAVGGVAIAEISKQDGRILRISHGR